MTFIKSNASGPMGAWRVAVRASSGVNRDPTLVIGAHIRDVTTVRCEA
jgi:hypothetical protein